MYKEEWINVDKRTQRLVIRFRCKGFPNPFFISTGLVDNVSNRAVVISVRNAIKSDMALGRFDSTLESYKFNPTRNARVSSAIGLAAKPKYDYTLIDVWIKFCDYQSTQLEKTTIRRAYGTVENLIKSLPTVNLQDAVQIRDYLVNIKSKHRAYRLFGYLSQACDWGVDNGLIADNPFLKIKIAAPKKKSTDEDYRAFTLEQRDLIIDTFEHHSKHSFYAPLVKFLFWTGCRSGEAFALTWGDISEDCTRITFNKSCNAYRVLKGTKNGKKRVFPTSVGSKLNQLLLSIKPTDAKLDDLVFRSKTGKKLNSDIVFGFWNKQHSSDRKKEYPGVIQQMVAQGKLPRYLNQYSTRHTFATWAIASGTTPEKVAKLIGDTIEIVLKHYVHPDVVEFECPDF